MTIKEDLYELEYFHGCKGYSDLIEYHLPMVIAKPVCVVRSILSILKQYCLDIYCQKFGHDIECDSWANPETGGEEFSCKRCGYHERVIYY